MGNKIGESFSPRETFMLSRLTSTIDDPCFFDRLLEHAEGVMEGPLRLIEDLLSGSSNHDGASFTKRDTREAEKLRERKQNDN